MFLGSTRIRRLGPRSESRTTRRSPAPRCVSTAPFEGPSLHSQEKSDLSPMPMPESLSSTARFIVERPNKNKPPLGLKGDSMRRFRQPSYAKRMPMDSLASVPPLRKTNPLGLICIIYDEYNHLGHSSHRIEPHFFSRFYHFCRKIKWLRIRQGIHGYERIQGMQRLKMSKTSPQRPKSPLVHERQNREQIRHGNRLEEMPQASHRRLWKGRRGTSPPLQSTCKFLESSRGLYATLLFSLQSLRSPRCVVPSLAAALPRWVGITVAR
jgi:hypothetical protein